MKCEQCQITKLSKEFPDGTISSKCEHIMSWCLECLVSHLKETHQCPICKIELIEQEVNDCFLFWNNSSFKIDIESLSQARAELSGPNDADSGVFYVVLLNGKKITLKTSEIKTVKALKYALRDATKIEITKQKLIHNDVELNDFQDDTTNSSTLENYGIHSNSHIQLIVVLYSITQDQALTSLIFDLYWGFPSSGQDFLDGTCLIYASDKLWKKYDYLSSFYPSIPYIKHSGDVIDHENARGHHKISVKLDQLPNNVGQLYLILSSWRSPTIGHFRNPSFKLYDEADPERQLCNYTIKQAANSQAVIMCLINRSNNGLWQILEVGENTCGNAKNYIPIQKNISRLTCFNRAL